MFDTDYRSFDLTWHAHCYLAEYLFDFPRALSWLTGVRLCFSLYPHQITTPSSSDFLLGFVLGCFGFHIRPPHRSAYFEIKVSPSPPLRFYHCCSPLAGLLGTLYLSQISFFPSLRRGISNPQPFPHGSALCSTPCCVPCPHNPPCDNVSHCRVKRQGEEAAKRLKKNNAGCPM